MAIQFKSVDIGSNGIETIQGTASFGDDVVVSASVMLQSIYEHYSGDSNHPLRRIIFNVTNVTYSGSSVTFDAQPVIKDNGSGYMSGYATFVVVAQTTETL